MNYIKKNIIKIVSVAIVFFLPVLTFGQAIIPPPTGDSAKIVNPISSTTLEGLIKTILEGVLKIGIPVIALAIIYCGFLFVAARGVPEKIGKAKESLIYTLIGAAILLGAWALALLIKNTVVAL